MELRGGCAALQEQGPTISSRADSGWHQAESCVCSCIRSQPRSTPPAGINTFISMGCKHIQPVKRHSVLAG